MSIGAKWWKFDFHTHTPASSDYGKGEDQILLKERSAREWLLDYMKKEIDCVAVTDHNTGGWINILKNELREMEIERPEGFRPITIFPGVEINVSGGIHVLAIFNPSANSEDIFSLLGEVEYEGDRGKTNGSTRKSFKEVVPIIQKYGIAIPAHVDGEAGLFSVSRGNTLKENLEVDGLLAMEVSDSDNEKPPIYNELKLNLAEIVGSDSHHPEHVGSKYTWVKMEEPNIEALRLALHDGADGIIRFDSTSNNPNDFASRYYIKNITITDGAKAGRGDPLKVDFSPWFTTLIGGRGSGKSSIIEYLRIGLDNVDDLPESLMEEHRAFAQVPSSRGQPGMFTDKTELRIELYKDGRDIALVWKDHEIYEELKNEYGNWVSQGNSNIVSKRFPVRMYSQKQLYEMVQDPQAMLKLIDKQFDKRQWLNERERLESQWLTYRRKARELENHLSNVSDMKAELNDINAKLKIFEESDHQEVLKNYQDAHRVDNEISTIIRGMEGYTERVQQVINEDIDFLHFSEFIEGNIDDSSLDVLQKGIRQWKDIHHDLRQIIDKLNRFNKEFGLKTREIPFQKKKNKAISAYQNLARKLAELGEDTSVYGELLDRKQKLEKGIKEIDRFKKEHDKKIQLCNRIRKDIEDHEKKLRVLREEVINSLNQRNKDIIISLDQMGDVNQAEASFRYIIRKKGDTYARDIIEFDEEYIPRRGFIFELKNETNNNLRWQKRDDLIRKVVGATESDLKGFGKPFVRHINALEPEDIDRLEVWYPEDKITLKLVVNGREEDIDTGSAGQRTAAMLSLILSLDDTPLIIDQPEDDLDTQRITDLVVAGLRNLKMKQQVIVVTHNPNIPVNGGAENIVHLSFLKGAIRVRTSGALQNKEVRQAVCDIMEGGSEALSSRYYRIFKALEH